MIDFIMNFLNEALIALIITSIVILAAAIYVFVFLGRSFKGWKVKEGKGAAASAVLGVGSIILLAFIFSALAAIFGSSNANADSDMNGTFFNDTSVFLGIDHTFKVSPQCVEGGTDDRLTSNLGINQNLWRSYDKVHDVSLRLTHHSCVWGKDRNGYDGLGLSYSWTLIRR
tara:strand:+ start:5060 stop:5572 length:513 start_codon:yes stop_codon:yes gene_type:complete